MRLQLLLILWFALTAWSGHADAYSMAHCQTHSAQSNAAKISDASPVPEVTLLPVSTSHLAIKFLSINTDSPVNNIAAGNENVHEHIADSANSSHSCCDEQNTAHQCNSECSGFASCQSCGPLHGAAIPAVWQMTPAITQQKIQHLAYSYLHLHPVTQERPPKR